MASSAAEIQKLIEEQFAERSQAGEFDEALDTFMAEEVVPVWRGYSPEDTGAYDDSVQVTDPASGGKGQVGATVDYANLVEFGSEHNEESAPRSKTVEHFNGPQ